MTKTVQADFEANINVKQLKRQAVDLRKDEAIVVYAHQLVELGSKLESTDHDIL